MRTGRRAVILRRALAILAGVALLAALGASGSRFLWCSVMERAMSACCCDDPSAEEPRDHEPEARRACCCELREHDRVAAARAPSDAPCAATLDAVAVLPELPFFAGVAAEAQRPATRRALRSSPSRDGPPSGAERCIRLRVLRC